jgi:hypothetical protein
LRLTYVGVSYHHDFHLRKELVPWSSLHEAQITWQMSFKNSVSILAQCTSARTVSLSGMEWTMTTHIEISHLQLSTTTLHLLTSLTLADSTNPSALLEYLTLPALTNLTLRTRQALFSVNVSNFGAFLKRSQCPLERLTMLGLRMSRFETTLFLNLPEVVKVALVDISFEGVAKMFENFSEDEEMRNLLGHPVFSKFTIWTSYITGPEMCQHVGWKQSLGKKKKILASTV